MQLHLDLMGGLAGDMFIAAVLDAFPEHGPRLAAVVAALGPRFDRPEGGCRVVAFNDGLFAGSRFEVTGDEAEAAGDRRPDHRAEHRHEPRAEQPHLHAQEHWHEQQHPRRDRGDHDHDPEQARGREPGRHEHGGHEHGREHGHSHDHDHDHDHARNHAHDHPGEAGSASLHSHVAWADIERRLHAALEPGVRHHALGIFERLAEAEAAVHGVPVAEVQFHEVGAWDSIVDIVGAAVLIDALDVRRWSVGPVPLGSGRIRTAHGWMPVPPPATARLLEGFETIDDGIGGERVTPTGAAILAHLMPGGSPGTAPREGLSAIAPQGGGRSATALDGTSAAAPGGTSSAPLDSLSTVSPGGPPAAPHGGVSPSAPRAPQTARPRVLRRSGIGFGTRRLDGISNCVRVLAFDEAARPAASGEAAAHRELAVVEFEVDDQSAEDLAIGLDRLRGHAAIFDVVQAPVFGKKGRMMTAVRLLARPAALAEVIEACFRETTTIGLRHSTVRGAALPRRADEVGVDGHRVRVKTVERPGGATAKAESDDALAHETHRERRRLRSEAERLVLERLAKAARDE